MFVCMRYLLRLSVRIILGRMTIPLPPKNLPHVEEGNLIYLDFPHSVMV